MYPASFNFCICTLKLPAVAFVFSLRKVNSASLTLIKRDMTAKRNCECNIGSRSLNTRNNISFPYFFKLLISNMPGNNVAGQNGQSVKEHHPLKTFEANRPLYIPWEIIQRFWMNKPVYEQAGKCNCPRYIRANDGRLKIQRSSIYE